MLLLKAFFYSVSIKHPLKSFFLPFLLGLGLLWIQQVSPYPAAWMRDFEDFADSRNWSDWLEQQYSNKRESLGGCWSRQLLYYFGQAVFLINIYCIEKQTAIVAVIWKKNWKMSGIFPVRLTSKVVTEYTYGPILHKIWAQPQFRQNFQRSTICLMQRVSVVFDWKDISRLTYCS